MRKINGLLLLILLILAQSALLSADRLGSNHPIKEKVDRATISVTDMTGGVTATDLVNNILGGGVTTSNIVYTGAAVASGVFTGGTGAGIGINQGIMLSTGGALNAVGPNQYNGVSFNNDLAGDNDLNILIGGSTWDASVLEFDFIPTSANFQFTFVMGSDEYEEYIQYADVFAFYLNGTNIALIPSTSIPISIGTINQNVNTAYYVSNFSWPGPYDIECDGFTIPISLNATVIPNVTNHIKLAVADLTDHALDTWIFINGGSFTSGYNVNVTSTPAGATIFKDGINTGLLTPSTILQATGTTAVYRVEKVGYAYSPASITVPNISADQNINFNGSLAGFTYYVTSHDVLNPGGLDLNAEILYIADPDGIPVSFIPPVFCPYTFGLPGNEPFVEGRYAVVKECWSEWIPESVSFIAITTDYTNDFLGMWVCDQTPVELSSFTATLTAQKYVQLSWVSQSETNMMGYRVYRNETNDQSTSLMITPVLVPATNTSEQQTYTVTDNEVTTGQVYYYWLESVDVASSQFFGPLSIIVEGEVPPIIPEVSSMKSAYPNPFKADRSTSIEVALKGGETGTVTIYNVAGQAVRTFNVNEGTHTITWNGVDSKGQACSSGIYFYKLSTASINLTKKMVIIK